MMRAAVYRRKGQLEVLDVPVPDMGPADVMVKVDYCGVCGTDLHMMLDGWGEPDMVYGHEWSGRVVQKGPDARIDTGATVVGRSWVECGQCKPCAAGRPGLCERRPRAGEDSQSGAFAAYLTIDHRNLLDVPCGVSARDAAYTEPLAVAMHAVTVGSVEAGRRAMVFGCGPIGAAVVAVLGTRGIDVTVIEPHELRRDLARRLGAVVASPEDLEVPGHPGEVPADAVNYVFETSGARSAVETGLTQLTGGATMVLVGTGMNFPRLDTNRVILNELFVTGAFDYDTDGFAAALELIASKVLPLDVLLEPESVTLDGLMDAMRRLRSGAAAGKVLVCP